MFGKYNDITYLYSVLNCPNLFQYGASKRQTKIIIVCLFCVYSFKNVRISTMA